mgnify:CR=1 FL=1
MSHNYELNKCIFINNLNNRCYLHLRPDKTEDAFRCYNCNKITLHKLNPVEYINNEKNKMINNITLEHFDNRPLFY